MAGLRIQILVVVAALMLMTVQCLAACAAQPCEQVKVPPCHKHPANCMHAPIVGDAHLPLKSVIDQGPVSATIAAFAAAVPVLPRAVRIEPDLSSPAFSTEPEPLPILRI